MNLPSHPPRRAAPGFNLIEVTLAVAIVGIGLLSVLGLVAGGIDASRGVSDETLICNVVDDIMDWTRITPYGNDLWFPSGVDLDVHDTDTVLYLDANGNLPETEYMFTNRFYSDEYFRFTIRVLDDPTLSNAPADLSRIRITVDWPVNPVNGQPVTNARQRVFITHVARK